MPTKHERELAVMDEIERRPHVPLAPDIQPNGLPDIDEGYVVPTTRQVYWDCLMQYVAATRFGHDYFIIRVKAGLYFYFWRRRNNDYFAARMTAAESELFLSKPTITRR